MKKRVFTRTEKYAEEDNLSPASFARVAAFVHMVQYIVYIYATGIGVCVCGNGRRILFVVMSMRRFYSIKIRATMKSGREREQVRFAHTRGLKERIQETGRALARAMCANRRLDTSLRHI